MKCNYCHVQGQNDLDDKETKKTARQMMKMVDQLNATFFDGKPRVSCASCHNGRTGRCRTAPLAIEMTPQQAAAAAAGRGRGGAGGGPGGAPGGPGRGRAAAPAPPERPRRSIRFLRQYVQALGGTPALQNAKTRVMTGTLTTRDLVASNVTVQEKATGEYRIDVATLPNPTVRATNGTAAWVVGGGRGGGGGGAPDAPRDLTGFPLQQGLRLADFALPLRLKERYTSLLVNKAYETIDARLAVVITGIPYPNVTEQFAFDRETGLLLQRRVATGSGGAGFTS